MSTISSTDRLAFADFDRRARAGERLNVVFFGCSLTWGANATDPQLTGYRGRMAEKFESAYPEAHFKFWDAAIGGTNSPLGVFRFERDAASRKPDLVFLDFTLNDNHDNVDADRLASYESLVRRTILETNCPAALVFFPSAGDVRNAEKVLPRDEAHRAIGQAYGCAIGDAVALMRQKAAPDFGILDQWWPHPTDKCHPGDLGYEQYAEAAWDGYLEAVKAQRVSHAPDVMLHDDTYMNWRRQRLSSLGYLPSGWSVGTPNCISAWYDSLMSRWLDDETIAEGDAGAHQSAFRLEFDGTVALLFGESTLRSGRLLVLVDGEPSTYAHEGVFDLDAKGAGGNVKWAATVATGLDPNQPHTLDLIPLLEVGQELRIESLCTAGFKSVSDVIV